jgi:hypothetical protein
VQDKAAPGFDRSALEHLHSIGAVRQLNALGSRNNLELYEQIGKFYVGRRVIDNDAHRTFGRVSADIDHSAREAFIIHRGHRDQHLPVEIAAPGGGLRRFA